VTAGMLVAQLRSAHCDFEPWLMALVRSSAAAGSNPQPLKTGSTVSVFVYESGMKASFGG
jgi:hypothetical protein